MPAPTHGGNLPDAFAKQRLSGKLTTASGNKIVRSYVQRINLINFLADDRCCMPRLNRNFQSLRNWQRVRTTAISKLASHPILAEAKAIKSVIAEDIGRGGP
jgi:hypothetical protein